MSWNQASTIFNFENVEKEPYVEERPNLSTTPIALVIKSHGSIITEDGLQTTIDLTKMNIKSLTKIGLSAPGNFTSFNPDSEKFCTLQESLDAKCETIDINTDELLKFIVSNQKHKSDELSFAKYTEDDRKKIERFKFLIDLIPVTYSETPEGQKLKSTWINLHTKYTIFRYKRYATGPQPGLYNKNYSYTDEDPESMKIFMDEIFEKYGDFGCNLKTENGKVSITLKEILECISKKYPGRDIIIVDTSCNGSKCPIPKDSTNLGGHPP